MCFGMGKDVGKGEDTHVEMMIRKKETSSKGQFQTLPETLPLGFKEDLFKETHPLLHLE